MTSDDPGMPSAEKAQTRRVASLKELDWRWEEAMQHTVCTWWVVAHATLGPVCSISSDGLIIIPNTWTYKRPAMSVGGEFTVLS